MTFISLYREQLYVGLSEHTFGQEIIEGISPIYRKTRISFLKRLTLGIRSLKRRSFFLPILIVSLLNLFGSQQIALGQSRWTEEKIGKISIKADQAATRKKWSQAIKHGEQGLKASTVLYGANAPETISRLRTLNRYYDKAGRLTEIAARVKRAYFISKEYFPPTHNTAAVSRLLYYKLLIAQKDYKNAIPVVLENITTLTNSRNDQFRHMHYLGQLHGLYGLTDQLPQRERALLKFLELNKKLVGESAQDNMKIIMNLARTYCLQNKVEEFKALTQTYGLDLKC